MGISWSPDYKTDANRQGLSCAECNRLRAEIERGWLICDPCRAAKNEEREAQKWAAAEPAPPDYSGPYYVECCGDFVLDQNMDEWAKLNDEDPGSIPDLRIYACTRVRPTTDASRVIEAATEEMHDGAYDEADPDELQELLDAYWERQDITSWAPNFSRKIVPKKEGK